MGYVKREVNRRKADGIGNWMNGRDRGGVGGNLWSEFIKQVRQEWWGGKPEKGNESVKVRREEGRGKRQRGIILISLGLKEYRHHNNHSFTGWGRNTQCGRKGEMCNFCHSYFSVISCCAFINALFLTERAQVVNIWTVISNNTELHC